MSEQSEVPFGIVRSIVAVLGGALVLFSVLEFIEAPDVTVVAVLGPVVGVAMIVAAVVSWRRENASDP